MGVAMKIQSINPATEEVNKEFETFGKEEIREIFKGSRRAFGEWGALDISERSRFLRKLADALRKKKEEYARLITIEMGKPIGQAASEIEKCAWTAEVFAENATKWLGDEDVKTEAVKSYVSFEPLGVILSIMPWNFPFWQALRFGIPALIAGNVSVLRHSNTVPMCSLAIEEAFRNAGFPDNVFRSIITDHDMVKKLLKSRLVDCVSVTGSVEVGKQIAAIAGKNMKKFVLELGGSDPFIVLEDADIELACSKASEARIIAGGQSCIAAKRFIVEKGIADEFIGRFTELMRALKVGNPLDGSNQIGPLANSEQLLKLQGQVKDAVEKGAKVECGGKKIDGKGFFFEPTVLTKVNRRMGVLKEEVFGPVGAVVIAKDEEDAIRIANDTRFGLGASVWTKDYLKGEGIAKRLEAGSVHVNNIVHSDPRLPFGGIKDSGIGRELYKYGLIEFVNIKSIVIDKAVVHHG